MGHSNKWFVYWDYQNEKSIYTCVKDGESVWTIVCEYAKLIQIQGFGILYDSMGETKGHCQLIDLSTGAVVWELDQPGARISGVYPYEDKVVIVWFPPMGEEDKSRVVCGGAIWEDYLGKSRAEVLPKIWKRQTSILLLFTLGGWISAWR